MLTVGLVEWLHHMIHSILYLKVKKLYFGHILGNPRSSHNLEFKRDLSMALA